METLILFGLLIFVGTALVQSIRPSAQPPRVIYVLAEPPKPKPEAGQGAGCLPLVVAGFVIALALWLL